MSRSAYCKYKQGTRPLYSYSRTPILRSPASFFHAKVESEPHAPSDSAVLIVCNGFQPSTMPQQPFHIAVCSASDLDGINATISCTFYRADPAAEPATFKIESQAELIREGIAMVADADDCSRTQTKIVLSDECRERALEKCCSDDDDVPGAPEPEVFFQLSGKGRRRGPSRRQLETHAFDAQDFDSMLGR